MFLIHPTIYSNNYKFRTPFKLFWESWIEALSYAIGRQIFIFQIQHVYTIEFENANESIIFFELFRQNYEGSTKKKLMYDKKRKNYTFLLGEWTACFFVRTYAKHQKWQRGAKNYF